MKTQEEKRKVLAIHLFISTIFQFDQQTQKNIHREHRWTYGAQQGSTTDGMAA